ncbi:Pyruvate/Phosphoenolpyruvate kinase-like domain containing protein [Parasponia andersonii]|uniref:Pyruvate/Phosphoenolpyruvate kinase-like domain containing protein n=1 Tax=Parasponia andersonii TaxID=3476 RepID=A0A2P5D0V4_PARAD|nr:Pyruvate/Phosphoenolpyruvate kinase-like domain containing protein [Parasponia andersonii]
MSLQLQLQMQLSTIRNQSVCLSIHGSHHPNPSSPSPISNLSFRSSTVQQSSSLLPLLPHKRLKASASVFSSSKRPIPDLGIVASANSADTDYVAAESPASELRRILSSPGIHQIPACFDALSAKLVERAGFKCTFAGGFAISAAKLGMPDAGLISYGEMVEQGRQITQAVSIPVFGDADTGYGNAMNVKRTVKEYIRAGFAGISLEDQVSPKACGHTQGRKVVSREEAVMRIKAAVDARRESGSSIVIVARSDSRQAESLEESLWRAQAFADAGADVIFITALTSKQEMIEFCKVAPHVPKLASMLEGGGKTPILSPAELEAIGYKLVLYPLSLLGVSIRAMQDALTSIESGHVPHESMPTFTELKEIVGFDNYNKEEERYATHTS